MAVVHNTATYTLCAFRQEIEPREGLPFASGAVKLLCKYVDLFKFKFMQYTNLF